MHIRLLAVVLLVLLLLTPAVADQKSVTLSLVVNHKVTLSWLASTSTVVGYNVYRGGAAAGPFTKITSLSGLTYTDVLVTAGQTYFYMVRSVNTNNVESVNSNVVSAMAPTP